MLYCLSVFCFFFLGFSAWSCFFSGVFLVSACLAGDVSPLLLALLFRFLSLFSLAGSSFFSSFTGSGSTAGSSVGLYTIRSARASYSVTIPFFSSTGVFNHLSIFGSLLANRSLHSVIDDLAVNSIVNMFGLGLIFSSWKSTAIASFQLVVRS